MEHAPAKHLPWDGAAMLVVCFKPLRTSSQNLVIDHAQVSPANGIVVGKHYDHLRNFQTATQRKAVQSKQEASSPT